MMYSLIHITVIIWLISTEFSLQFDYCSLNCKNPPEPQDHVLCDDKCTRSGNITQQNSELSADEKREILKRHNEKRNEIALGKNKAFTEKTSSNMMELVWNDEMEKIAQCWAYLGLAMKHDQCRKAEKYEFGQNLYATSHTDSNVISKNTVKHLKDSVDGWYSEYTFVTPADKIENVDLIVHDAYHFTQVIWATSESVGCGKSYYTVKDKGLNWHTILIVCNYGPLGNIQGAPVFKFGKPCSECPNGESCSSEFPGLCANAKSKAKKFQITPIFLLIGFMFSITFFNFSLNF